MRRLFDLLVFALVERRVRRRFRKLIERTSNREPPGERRPLRVAVPRTANEKFLWRKIFDHDPRFTTVCDKLSCKEWVAALGLGVDMAPVRWVGVDAALIPRRLLARDVVVKASHGCGTNLFPRRDAMSRDKVVRKANTFLETPHGAREHEWGYFDVERRLFVEDVVGVGGAPLTELKFYTFGGRVPRVVHIADRFGDMAAAKWEPGPGGAPLRAEGAASVSERVLDAPLPACYPRALAVAKAIGAHFDHMRVDFLTDGDRFWLGELTAYNLGGKFRDCGHREEAPLSRAWDIGGTWFLATAHEDPLMRLYADALRRRLGSEPAARAYPASL